jgi:hypothetical protein
LVARREDGRDLFDAAGLDDSPRHHAVHGVPAGLAIHANVIRPDDAFESLCQLCHENLKLSAFSLQRSAVGVQLKAES